VAQRRQSQGDSSACLKAGLIGCLVVAVGGLVVLGIGFYVAKGWISGLVEDYTDTQPMELPQVTLSDEDLAALQARVKAFKDAFDAGEAAPPLVLSGDEINALIQQDEDLKHVVYVTIEGDRVRGQISVPLEQLGFEMVKGRYLNAQATFNVFVRDGFLFVGIDSAEVRGKAIPEEIMAEVRSQNFAKDATNDPEVRDVIRRIESLEVADGRIMIVPKAVAQ
jgi:hypothetical protein